MGLSGLDHGLSGRDLELTGIKRERTSLVHSESFAGMKKREEEKGFLFLYPAICNLRVGKGDRRVPKVVPKDISKSVTSVGILKRRTSQETFREAFHVTPSPTVWDAGAVESVGGRR